jgi:hypothetical protein
VDPPWGHFEREFIWFHRPLSEYWRAFRETGFLGDRFEQPRARGDVLATLEPERLRRKLSTRPYSVAFRLEKPTA